MSCPDGVLPRPPRLGFARSVANDLFKQFFDYAGVFPPASLPLDSALVDYRAARSGENGWLLGPFLLRASQLDDFSDATIPFGVILDVEMGAFARDPIQVEARVSPDEPIRLPPAGVAAFYEAAFAPDHEMVNRIAHARQAGFDVRAKIRTGGEEPSAFPSVEDVARFIADCIAHDVPYKATAGLHNPFRHPSTVEGATEHGFMNLLAATRARLADPAVDLIPILSAEDPAEFEAATATWRAHGENVPPAAVRRIFHAVGTCNISEPVNDLMVLGALGANP